MYERLKTITVKEPIKNWQYLCIFGRLSGKLLDKLQNDVIYHDGKEIVINICGTSVNYTDKETGEILLRQGENGLAEYMSNWANEAPKNPYERF